MQGLMEVPMTEVTETSLSKSKEPKKRKSNNKNISYASLQDIQKIISKSLETDERKIKETNAKKSVLSEQKWSNAMWNSILEEGETDKSENVNLIHIPSKSTINLEPKAPPGYKIREFGPMDQKNIFEELLTQQLSKHIR